MKENKFTLTLPVLVTKIIENWISEDEINQLAHKRVVVRKERMLSSYKNTLDLMWTVDLAREHVPAMDVPSEEEGETSIEVDSDDEIGSYFDETPTDPRLAIPHLAKGMGKMAWMMEKMKKLLKGKPKERASTSGGPTLRRSHTECSSVRKRRLRLLMMG